MNAADFLNQIIAYRNGAPVRFADIGTAVDSVENLWLSGRYNGKTGDDARRQSSARRQHDRRGRCDQGRLAQIRAQLPPSITA